jgi:pimeloyl-ACP methyl ester carboxylesterase
MCVVRHDSSPQKRGAIEHTAAGYFQVGDVMANPVQNDRARALPVATAAEVCDRARMADQTPLSHHFLELGDVRLHYVSAGEGPLVVLLHGFPEFWYTWRRLIPALAQAGYRVVAPDMRGVNLSSKPSGVRAYGIRALVSDVARLIRALGNERAYVVGHDWGAGVAWSFAMRHPELLRRLVVLNGPHPERLMRGMLSPSQLLKSWYMFFFQLPFLPELVARRRDYAFLLNPLRREPRFAGEYSEEDLARYREALAQPGALTAMINYYRAMVRPGTGFRLQPVAAPVLVVWGARDRHLDATLARPDNRLVPNARVEYLPFATHWVHHDCPDQVTELLVQFMKDEVRAEPTAPAATR